MQSKDCVLETKTWKLMTASHLCLYTIALQICVVKYSIYQCCFYSELHFLSLYSWKCLLKQNHLVTQWIVNSASRYIRRTGLRSLELPSNYVFDLLWRGGSGCRINITKTAQDLKDWKTTVPQTYPIASLRDLLSIDVWLVRIG